MRGRDTIPSTRRRGERGFTLVELLVALVLLGMLSALLYAGMRDGARAARSVAAHAEGAERVALVQSFLRARIASIGRPDRPAPAPKVAAPWFDGASDSLSVTVPWLDALPVAGLYRLAFRVTEGPDGLGLLRLDWRPDRAGADGSDPDRRSSGTRILLDGIRRARLRYFGAAEAGEAPAWHDAWTSGARPPDLVRVEIELADPARSWPLLDIAVP